MPAGFPPQAYIVVWPENGDRKDAARIYINAETVVKMKHLLIQADTNWTVLTVGRKVAARVSLGGETSCPMGVGSTVILVHP